MKKGIKVTLLLKSGDKVVLENVLCAEPVTQETTVFCLLLENGNIRHKWYDRENIDKIMFN